jgi:regulator of protease activity HflC (stomatin/prohibitin superfamily)
MTDGGDGATPAGVPGPGGPAGRRAAGPPATLVMTERPAVALLGWPIALAVVIIGILGIGFLSAGAGQSAWAELGLGVALLAVALIVGSGLTQVAPGQARVVQLFGRYTGTIRAEGLQWVNPVTKRHKISTRIRNHETGVTKVNDVNGNPIEIAAVVVWRVIDTAQALFGVDDFTSFVAIQAETAVRRVASSYPYDTHVEGVLSLRQNAEGITLGLAAEIADRVRPAGVEVLEARLTKLAYAPEIAGVMLRRQQAGAVVAARQLILDGAIGMVEGALERLAVDGAVDLDDERKAAMVSNLLVVLCSDHATQPIVNTGTLYQ